MELATDRIGQKPDVLVAGAQEIQAIQAQAFSTQRIWVNPEPCTFAARVGIRINGDEDRFTVLENQMERPCRCTVLSSRETARFEVGGIGGLRAPGSVGTSIGFLVLRLRSRWNWI